MQQDALADIEDFGGPDPFTGRRALHWPGKDAPYANYQLGAAYDEMFTPRRQAARILCGAGSPAFHPAAGRTECAASRPASKASCIRASPSPSITTTRRPSGSSPPTFCRASSRPRNGTHVERGLTQRIHALNLFLRDIYGDGRVLKDGIVPREMIYGSKHYRREMRGLPVPHGAYVNVCGSDLIRNEAGEFRRAGRQSARALRRLLHAGQPRCGAPRLSRQSSAA